MRSRGRLWILAAVLLLAGAALFSSFADERRPAPAQDVAFPRWMRTEERTRAVGRRSLPPITVATSSGEQLSTPRRDPFLVALPRTSRDGAVVFEANALRHSRLGELFVDCIQRTSKRDPFEEMRQEIGVDPLKDIDRVAVSADGVVVSGFFDRARFDRFAHGVPATPYGDEARIYVERPGSDTAEVIGVWRDQLLVVGRPDYVRGTLDRVEGRAPDDGDGPIPEHLTYGEAYGVVPGTALQSLFTGTQEDLGRRLAAVAQRIELHADAMGDVALVARVTGTDAAGLEDLGTAFGAALSLGRLDARVRGDTQLAELLEHARVVRDGRGFSLELALPVDVVERWFEACRPPAEDAAR